MAVLVDESRCTGCGICAQVCPVEAITVTRVVSIDSEQCIVCGVCASQCLEEALSIEELVDIPSASKSFASSSSHISPPSFRTFPTLPHSPERPPAAPPNNGNTLFGHIVDFFRKSNGATDGKRRDQRGGQESRQGFGRKQGIGRGRGNGNSHGRQECRGGRRRNRPF